jgi:hypothetical protein
LDFLFENIPTGNPGDTHTCLKVYLTLEMASRHIVNPTTSEFTTMYIQRQRCSGKEHFLNIEENRFVFKTL